MTSRTTQTLDAANAAYIRGDFQIAKEILDRVIEDAPESPQGVGARYLRGRGYEDGVFTGVHDLPKAYADFCVVKEHADNYGSDGLLGCARVLMELGRPESTDEIISLCERAIECDSNVKAMMLLGYLHETVLMDRAASRKWYWRAFRSGLPWGGRFFARSHAEEGNIIRAVLAHSLTTVMAPWLVLRHGARSPFK